VVVYCKYELFNIKLHSCIRTTSQMHTIKWTPNTNSTNKRQKVTLKVLAMDVIVISSTEPTRLPVLQVGGHSQLSNG